MVMESSCNIVLFVLLWLLTLSNVDLCIYRVSCEVECIPSERNALLKMKSHLSGPLERLASWSPNTNCCNWPFIICHNITGHVLQLHLTIAPLRIEVTDNHFDGASLLGGEVHPSLLDLKHLNYLDLSGSDFGGMQIPGFLGSMTSLTYLNLSHAGFGKTIPIQLCNISNLVYLDLGGNYYFEGSVIPHQIGKLSNLQYLDLGDNGFNGNIPHQIGKLSNLQYLDLGYNRFSGNIPHQIGNLSNLLHLDLRGNKFSGSFSHQIGNLSNLIHLCVGGDYQLNMDRSMSSISVESLQWISTLSSLQYLELSNVNLSSAFDWLQVLHLLPYLRELHLIACDFKHHFEPSTLNFSSLVVLELSDSYFGTSFIPNWIFQLKKLVRLQLNSNIQDSIPYGIQNLTLLQHLDLSENFFNSSIPSWLYSFSHLKSLILHDTSLVGSISSNIGNLTSLVTLDLSNNNLDGSIPISLGNLCKLKKLALRGNNCNQKISNILKILSTRCLCPALEFFDMSHCQLSGHLTGEIGLFKNLVELYLSQNFIQGPIHSSLTNLSSLKYLDFSHNSIEGAIPISFPNLSSLMYLDLSDNQLDGNPFENLGSLSRLNELRLGYNLFHGVVKEAHLVNFTHLQVFVAQRNQLTLEVAPNWNPPFQSLERLSLSSWNLGPHFPSWIQSLKYLGSLDISNAMICDSITTFFGGIIENLSYLNLSHNHIEGDLSNILINTTFSVIVDLSSNKLYGQLPYVSQHVWHIDLSRNLFSGSISHFLCHKEEETKSLEFLNLASNNLSGTVPDCWKKWPDLMEVNLENNHFTGIFHTSVTSLAQLEMLNLRNNSFSGKFPSFLKKAGLLTILDLGENQFSGMVPSWVGRGFSSLKIFVLRSNKFSGPIPHQICDMRDLQILDLALNELTGYIPKCFTHLSSMLEINKDIESQIDLPFIFVDQLIVETLLLKGRVYDYSTNLGLITSLDFSCNELSGEIPTELTRLKGLHFLNLSNNHFIGGIPQSIGNMESLESMDFSRNHLSGEIPPSMSQLSFLNHLNLSYNELVGKIPTGTQLQSFEASSFVGNFDLCGPPLNNCSSNSSNNKDEVVRHHGNGINWFFVCMGFGFIVGFWSVVGPLLFNRSWRFAYYQFIDRMCNKIVILLHLEGWCF